MQNTLQEKKEQYLQELEAKVVGYISETTLIGKFTTCDYPTWNQQEYAYMPEVARRLRAKGYKVTSSVNHGVTDWLIAV